MTSVAHDDLIHDWNGPSPWPQVQIFDETLRDGLQSPSVKDPSPEQKAQLLRLMNALSVHMADIGLPGAGERAKADVLHLLRVIAEEKLSIAAACAARTVVRDIEPIADVVQKSGVPVEVYTFIGSSPIRFFAESWSLDTVLGHIREAVAFARKQNLVVTLVTEDTTRSSPAMLQPMFQVAIDEGATGLCLCDTVGHATPDGARALLQWAKNWLASIGRSDIRLDWHGHNDRGLGVVNTLEAARAGAMRIHGSALGVGERVGNTSIEQLIVNLKLGGAYPGDVSRLGEFCDLAADALGVDIPISHPVVGRDAFRTGTGVHAAAIIKALRKNDNWLADRVYSSVPASEFGRKQVIEVGHMSGLSNVLYWFEAHGVARDEALVQRVFARAKASAHNLSDDEIWAEINA